MGAGNRVFSDNVEINSLAMAHRGAKVQPFTVSQWFKDGDMVYLDDSNKTKANALEVLPSALSHCVHCCLDCVQIVLTPGHTPDSISIYAHGEKRLFVGDNICTCVCFVLVC